jgi:quinol---cytochrome c reductase cytochrome c subunit, bacillus type
MDWHQLWEIVSTPDNVPIVALVPLLVIFTYMAVKQARANDDLIVELETNPALAKTHHRKTWPFKPGWQKEVHVWPFLLRIEFLAAIIVTAILMVWSITLNAPMEEPANPNVTMNPAKAPWYFLGLQELLAYFHPTVAGVLVPTFVLVGAALIPYVDRGDINATRPSQRKTAVVLFTLFCILGLVLTFVGIFFRGPGYTFVIPYVTAPGMYFSL